MSPPLPDRALRAFGCTEGDADDLALLVRDQDTRRLVLLRALLDAAGAAPATVCPPDRLDRLRRDWALLEAADRADRTAARAVLLHPLAGPWAQSCLRGLTATAPTPQLQADLDHAGALAAAAAIRARLAFTARLTARGGLLSLPTLGALRMPDGRLDIRSTGSELTLRHHQERPLVVHAHEDGTTSSPDPRWLPALSLPAVLPGAGPVPLDDLDPYRTAGSGLERHGLSGAVNIDDSERKAWTESWSGVEPLLRIGGEHRVTEAAVLLRCLVPLGPPPGSGPTGQGAAHCSGTRREAFGAVLSSKPATPAYFASTLVHELQHTKLSAVAALVRLHHEDAAPRHFAPWRSDPRPFDGLLQGAYSHIALADYWQRFALGAERVTHRDLAWAEHARCREQVGAVLPVLAGSGALTAEGRVLVNEMITLYDRLADCPPPTGHLARAQAYVSTARVIWQQRNGSRRA
ncbi:HEXXH motif-containing putative peptide modification protein [Streptomyces sp. NBC_00841]|uniref:aKG-HExxH-type peptide beta-hydroxylase n=1 Tax=unclassified Streptomyces TaxID=2593676 RepID=UPI0022510163|nr:MULTISPECIES: HEXXH motif-containing putative peptide modification protein [unclassified Streptomyces]MCX4532670.1 HEXXH motif-containing putative peptide modification protein [Streptomyces sp. NBC_01669]WSA01855.1 HEXXH motif-containing putative peptide modification protein [Streptomyces sp. NBC_00841]